MPNELETAISELETMRRELEATRRELAEANARYDAAQDRIATLKAEQAALVGERDAAKVESAKVETKLVEREVDAMVGVRFPPAERASQLELAKTNPTLWKAMAAEREEMPHLKPDPAGMGNDPTPRSIADTGSGQEFAAAIEKGTT